MSKGSLATIVMLASLGASGRAIPSASPQAIPARDAMFETIAALDGAMFDAFNHCSSPEELRKHAGYFAPDVEFYHDTGGVTWTLQEMIANTEKNVCGKFRRELVPGSLEVFHVKDFGAIERGVHRFCQFDTDRCEGMADFVIVWRHQAEAWTITRVLSFGHRPSKGAGS